MNVVQKLIQRAEHSNGLVLNATETQELAMAMHNMAEDLGKLMFLSDYFEKRYLQYRDFFGPIPEDEEEEVLEGLIEHEEEGQENEGEGVYSPSEAEGEMAVPEKVDVSGGEGN